MHTLDLTLDAPCLVLRHTLTDIYAYHTPLLTTSASYLMYHIIFFEVFARPFTCPSRLVHKLSISISYYYRRKKKGRCQRRENKLKSKNCM